MSREIGYTKGDIFDLFYSKQTCVRQGGGKQKSKICRNDIPFNKMNEVKYNITEEKLLVYFYKLLNRDISIAPPPKPIN